MSRVRDIKMARASVAAADAKNKETGDLIEVLHERVDHQRAELDHRTDNLNAIQRNFERISRMHADERQQVDQLKELVVKQQQEIDALKLKLNVMQQTTAEYEKVTAEYNEYREEMEDLAQRLRSREAELEKRLAEDKDSHMQATMQLEATIEEGNQRAASRDGTIAEMELEHRRLLDEIQALTSTLAESERRGDGLRTKYEALEADCNRLRGQVAKLEDAQATLGSAAQVAEGDRSNLRMDVAQLTTELNAARREIKRVTELLAERDADVDALRSDRDKYTAEWSVERDGLLGRIAQLEADLSSSREETTRARAETEAAKDEHKTAAGQWAEDRIEWQNRVDALEATARDMESQFQETRQMGEGLRRKEKEKSQAAGQEVMKMSAERARLLRELKDLQAEFAAFRESAQKAESLLQQRVSDATDSLEVANRRAAQLGASQATASELEEQLHAANERMQALEADKRALMKETAETMTLLTTAEDSLRVVQQEMLDMATRHNQYVLQAETEKEENSAELRRLRQELSQQQEQIDTLAAAVEDNKRRSSELEFRLREADDSREAALREVSVKQDEIDRLLVLQSEKDNRVEDGLKKLRTLQAEVQKTIKKVITAEEASESNFTCLSCMEIFTRPVMCVPCGHTFCDGCMERNDRQRGAAYCRECEEHTVTNVVPSTALDLLSGKFVYRKQVLSDLLTLVRES